MKTILGANFRAALHIAIEERRKVEKQHGYTGDSIFVAGLVEILEASKRGEQIIIEQSNGDVY